MLIDRELPLSSAALRSPTGIGRPYPPEVIAGVRALIEVSGLSHSQAAARSGLRIDTIGRWARRFGWRRGAASIAGAGGTAGAASTAGAGGAPGRLAENRNNHLRHAEARSESASRSTNDGGTCFETPAVRAPQHDDVGSFHPNFAGSTPRRPYRYGPELREAARVRIEGSRDGMERIGLELGVARWTLVRWRKRYGWRRPSAPRKVGPDFFRSKRFGRPYRADAVGTARDLVMGSTLPVPRIAARAGVCRGTVHRWMKLRGWTRPQGVPTDAYRPPYGPEVVAAARELYQTTALPRAFIAARVKATPERVGHWARSKGWTRARDMPDPHGRVARRRGRRRRVDQALA